MKRLLTTISLSLALVGCGGGSSSPDAGTNAPQVGAALPEAVDTASLEVDQDFSFATARTVLIEFDIESARETDADVSICTDFEPMGEVYDIDFNSCTVNGKLDEGMFSHSMEVTNDKASVIGVILFQDPQMAPIYKEFLVDNNQRMRGDGTEERVIVWK